MQIYYILKRVQYVGLLYFTCTYYYLYFYYYLLLYYCTHLTIFFLRLGFPTYGLKLIHANAYV